MQKLIVKSTNRKGKVKEKVFTEKQSAKALLFLCTEYAKGNKVERAIIEDGNN